MLLVWWRISGNLGFREHADEVEEPVCDCSNEGFNEASALHRSVMRVV
jgi:hypothetical protein